MSEMIKRALRNMMNPKPVPVAIPEGWALVPKKMPGPRVIDFLVLTIRRCAWSDRIVEGVYAKAIALCPTPPVFDDGPRLRARIAELEATVAQLRAEAKGLEELL